MRYVEFRDTIESTLAENPEGMTWKQLKDLLSLPYRRPCQTWICRLEKDIRLVRVKSNGREYIWKLIVNP